MTSETIVNITTAKGHYEASLAEVVAWQAEMQGAWASIAGEGGVEVDVDDIDFDFDNLAAAEAAVIAAFDAAMAE